MKLIVIFVLAASLLKCSKEEVNFACDSKECSITAIVKDLSGLDGCGLVLELKDGTRLVPERRTYIQAPTPEEDPIYYFHLTADDIVQISYRDSQFFLMNQPTNPCTAGKVVFVTCIKSCKQNIQE